MGEKRDPISIATLFVGTMLLSIISLMSASVGQVDRFWWIPLVELVLSLIALVSVVFNANRMALAGTVIFLAVFWTSYFGVGLPSMLRSEPVDPTLIAFGALFGLGYVVVAVRLSLRVRKPSAVERP